MIFVIFTHTAYLPYFKDIDFKNQNQYMYPQPACKNSQGWCKNQLKLSVLDVVLKSEAEMKYGQTFTSSTAANVSMKDFQFLFSYE